MMKKICTILCAALIGLSFSCANAVWFGLGVLTYNLTLAENLLYLNPE